MAGTRIAAAVTAAAREPLPEPVPGGAATPVAAEADVSSHLDRCLTRYKETWSQSAHIESSFSTDQPPTKNGCQLQP
jgi:hypothetical protein